MAYPIKLGREDGRRRLALLRSLAAQSKSVTMAKMPDGTARDDLRWLWANDLVQVVDDRPLRYAVSDAGERAILDAPAELEKIRAKEASKA